MGDERLRGARWFWRLSNDLRGQFAVDSPTAQCIEQHSSGPIASSSGDQVTSERGIVHQADPLEAIQRFRYGVDAESFAFEQGRELRPASGFGRKHAQRRFPRRFRLIRQVGGRADACDASLCSESALSTRSTPSTQSTLSAQSTL